MSEKVSIRSEKNGMTNETSECTVEKKTISADVVRLDTVSKSSSTEVLLGGPSCGSRDVVNVNDDVLSSTSSTIFLNGGTNVAANLDSRETSNTVVSTIVSDLLTSAGTGSAGSVGDGSSTTTTIKISRDNTSGTSLVNFGQHGSSNTTFVNFCGTVALDESAFSAIEQAILSSSHPLEFHETEVITVNGQTGIWTNKNEVLNWRGVIPITQYLINEDSYPEIIRKRTDQVLLYEQEVAIRYLRPPTPPPPGDIIIKKEKNIITPPAPPLIIRQQPPRPLTPPPVVFRETPPKAPAVIGQKVITISGKRLPPPPRKVIIERLAPLPSKPQSVIIERWLPYRETKRRVIFQKPTEADPVIPRPRNVIVQWEAPKVQIRKEFRDLGVIRVNPVEYVQKYGTTLKTYVDLPQFVKEIRPPVGIILAAEYTPSSFYELEGDLEALQLIDLDYEGLGEYKSWLSRFILAKSSNNDSFDSRVAELFVSFDSNASGRISRNEAEKLLLTLNSRLDRTYTQNDAIAFLKSFDFNNDGFIDFQEFRRGIIRELNTNYINAILSELYTSLDRDANNRISRSEAEKLILKINSRLGRAYGENDVFLFFKALDVNNNGTINFDEFRRGILRYFI